MGTFALCYFYIVHVRTTLLNLLPFFFHEWQIPHEDIRWVDEDPVLSRQTGRVTNPIGHGGVVPGAGRGNSNLFEKEFPPSQNGIAKNVSEDIEILHTDTLIKEVYIYIRMLRL